MLTLVFVNTGKAFFIVVVPDERAREIEVYSSKQNAWKRHLRPGDKTTYRHAGFEGDIPIAVVYDEENKPLAMSFNPESNTWGCRIPFADPIHNVLPPRSVHTFEYFGYGESMLAAAVSFPEAGYCPESKAGLVELEYQVKGQGDYLSIRYKKGVLDWNPSSCKLMNVSTCGGTVCFQWFNKDDNPEKTWCFLNKYGNDFYSHGVRSLVKASDNVFLLTCCE